jgi:hypothetical protein
MSDRFTRQHYKAVYGPLAQKTLHNVLKRELMEQFGFENMGLIADALVRRFLEILDAYSPDRIRLLPGQMLWLAVARGEKVGYGKSMLRSKLVPVILTVVSSEDLEAMANDRMTFQELRPRVVARILKEAETQGGVLAQSDVGAMLGISASAVSTAIQAYSKEHPDEVLPYRGTLHDMGPTNSHKLQAIELKFMGCLTREIARRLHHDASNVDAYQTDFERVYQLYRDGKDPNQISFLTKLSRRLVNEYIELINQYVIEEEKPSRRPLSKNKKGNSSPYRRTKVRRRKLSPKR